ncbi:type II toxin-antitoxin system Phd/YefM family antitoxin [Argonema galeatum]|uniref:type II toxin-antitoxin system Phd/YefM family antitoxin n=1 Tax=Argonema galeatum TaxID=2942762 RepID=UPI002012D887|nr:type II toxin-antitoxin system Phd/YefM family antitoxin [Argonema galeatum]MCL1467546.1 type II toxin-antitoxin system Phd/YefM family antitoxin [Argonema galeatum A003/A1]
MELGIIEEQTIENNSIIRMTATEVRDNFDEIVDRVADDEESVILSKDGKDVAAIIPIEEFWLLERLIEKLEDEIDLEEAKRRLEDPNEVPIPYEQVRKELGLA